MTYDEWKLSPPDEQKEPEVVAHCNHCGSAIHEGADAMNYQGDYYDTEECYFEQLCRDNPPHFKPIREDEAQ